MKVNYPDNPFTRQHAFNRHDRSHLSSSAVAIPTSRAAYQEPQMYHSRASHYPLNIWNFHDSHYSSFDIKMPNRNYQDISSFEKTILLSSSRRNTDKTPRGYPGQTSNYDMKSYAINQNPFYRKNLLVSREQIQEQIEKDLNKISYQQWSSNEPKYHESKRDSRRESSYANQPYAQFGQQRHYPNEIEENGSLIMNLVNERQVIDRFMPIIDANLKRGFSNQYDNHNPSISQVPYTSPTLQNIVPGINPQSLIKYIKDSHKSEITVRGKKFYKAAVISNKK